MNNVIDTVLDEKLIVIVRGVESEKLPFLAEAMYKGGIRSAFSYQIFGSGRN